MKKIIGLIGLGNIGEPMAMNLIQSGYRVIGFDVIEKPEFVSAGGLQVKTVEEISKQTDLIVQSLPTVQALETTVDALIEFGHSGQIIIELSSYPLKNKKLQVNLALNYGSKNEIIYAADKGIAIFAEKPQSLFLDEVFPMAEAIEKNNVPSICGFQMEYDTWYSKVRAYLSDKEVSSIMMINCGAVETHGVKHTIINKNDGPQDRIWTADRKWSGTSMVEAGIHQTDLMRYWTKDEIEWVSANYVERPIHLQEKEGDNPIAYHVSYCLKKGGIANLTLTKPAGVFFMERYDYILTTKSMIKFEKDLKVYGLGNGDYDINLGREHFKNNNIYIYSTFSC